MVERLEMDNVGTDIVNTNIVMARLLVHDVGVDVVLDTGNTAACSVQRICRAPLPAADQMS